MPCSWEILWCRRTSNGESLTGTTNSTWGQRPRKTWPCQVNWTLLTCDIMWPTCILGTFREDPQYPNSSRHLSVLLALQCFASWTRVPSNSWYIIYNGIYIYTHNTLPTCSCSNCTDETPRNSTRPGMPFCPTSVTANQFRTRLFRWISYCGTFMNF